MKQSSALLLTAVLMAFCGSAQADSMPFPPLNVTCFQDDGNSNTTITTVTQKVDYVQVQDGITTGFVKRKESLNVRPDDRVFSVSDRCLIEAGK
jgi:hypothetical protein